MNFGTIKPLHSSPAMATPLTNSTTARTLARTGRAMLLAVCVSSAGPALAQSPPQSTSPAATNRSGAVPDTIDAEPAASRLLAAARSDLSEGRRESAQRILEQLVARFPDTQSANEARLTLLEIYSKLARPAASGVTAPHEPQSAARTTAPPDATLVASGWRTSVRSFRRLQDELRNSIGDRVFFSAGSAELGSRAIAVISAQAQWLAHRPDIDVVVEGHADDTGLGLDQDALAASRAAIVRDRLMAEGVADARLRMAPKGSSDPVALCPESHCAAQNRRVVLHISLRGAQPEGMSDSVSPPMDQVDVRAQAPQR